MMHYLHLGFPYFAEALEQGSGLLTVTFSLFNMKQWYLFTSQLRIRLPAEGMGSSTA